MANNINQFFKENRKERKNEKFKVTKSFTDEKGEALEWELRPISNKKMTSIRRDLTGKDGKVDGQRFALALAAAAVVDPNLNDASLQDSYGVKKPEELLQELCYPAELDILEAKVLDMNGYGDDLGSLIEEAKNS